MYCGCKVKWTVASQVALRVIPCQINRKKSLPSPIWMKLGFYTVSVEILTHSEFQHSTVYGSELEPDENFGKFWKILAYLLLLNQP